MGKIIFDPSKVIKVPIGKVSPNPWNPKDKDTAEYKTVKRGIELKGLRLPIVVREHEGAYQIIDGEQRWTACGELGYEEVIVYNEGKVDDKMAKELTVWYEQKVPFNEIKLAELVTELRLEHGDLVELPFDGPKMDQMAELVKFDWDDFQEREPSKSAKESDSTGSKRTLTVEVDESDYTQIMKAFDQLRNWDGEQYSDAQALMGIIRLFLKEEA